MKISGYYVILVKRLLDLHFIMNVMEKVTSLSSEAAREAKKKERDSHSTF